MGRVLWVFGAEKPKPRLSCRLSPPHTLSAPERQSLAIRGMSRNGGASCARALAGGPAGRGLVGEEGSVKRERTVTELQGAAQEEGGSTPPLLAGLPGRCGGAGPAAQRRDVTVAAAVVGAGSAATKCELRRARAGGGVKSGFGGGEGRGRTAGEGRGGAGPRRRRRRRRPELVAAPESRAPCVSPLAPAVFSCTALLCPCSAPAPLARTLSSRPKSLAAPGFPLRLGSCCPRLHPGAGRALLFVTVAAAPAAPCRRQPGWSVGVGEA